MKALELAKELEAIRMNTESMAASELRRLAEVNAELLKALEACAFSDFSESIDEEIKRLYSNRKIARAAIAKAK